jgi:hypothetical protein
MMNPEPTPQPVSIITVASRAASSGFPDTAELADAGMDAGRPGDAAFRCSSIRITVRSATGRAFAERVGSLSRLRMEPTTTSAVMTTARPIAPAPNPESVGVARGLSARLDCTAGGACNFAKKTPQDAHLSVASC